MSNLMDVSMKDLRDELGRRELSSLSKAMYQQPVETVEEYRTIKKNARVYSSVFARSEDPISKGLKVALLFHFFDAAQAQQDTVKMHSYKSALDKEFAAYVC